MGRRPMLAWSQAALGEGLHLRDGRQPAEQETLALVAPVPSEALIGAGVSMPSAVTPIPPAP